MWLSDTLQLADAERVLDAMQLLSRYEGLLPEHRNHGDGSLHSKTMEGKNTNPGLFLRADNTLYHAKENSRDCAR